MSRDYCFTYYDTEREINFNKEKVKYIIYGREVCPDTKRKHLQGYVIFSRTCKIPKCQEWADIPKAHVEPKFGTRVQAREYCMKEGDWYEWGVFDAYTEQDLMKKPKKWLIDNGYWAFYCRYYRAISLLADKGPKWREVNVYWLWGEAGSGKTRTAMEQDDVYKIDAPYKWWDGYDSEGTLLIDDYESHAIERGALLNLLDGYRLRLETKGGHVWAAWHTVYVTSNKCPRDMGQWDSALARRVTEIRKCVTSDRAGVILTPASRT